MTNRTELTPMLNQHGKQRYADQGATHQGDSKPIKICSTCHRPVVFVQSTKTGKYYLADCYRYESGDRYYYVKASPHFKICATAAKQNQINDTLRQITDLNRQRSQEIEQRLQVLDRPLSPDIAHILDQILAEVNTKYNTQIAELEATIN